jgi:hypothetical protein
VVVAFLVGYEQAMREVDNTREIFDVANWRPR